MGTPALSSAGCRPIARKARRPVHLDRDQRGDLSDPVGDGSHLLEALLDDDFARNAALRRRSSRFVRPRSVRIYRSVCAAHMGWSAALMRALR